MKNYKKNDATTKVRILKPILDDWNDTITDTWVVEKCEYNPRRVSIRRKMESRKEYDIHGSLVHDIACICEAYDWCWAIYFGEDGIEVRI